VLQYAGGTCASSRFISVIFKRWSGRKLLDPTTYVVSMVMMQTVYKACSVSLYHYRECCSIYHIGAGRIGRVAR